MTNGIFTEEYLESQGLIQEGRLGDLIVVGILVKRMLTPIEKTKAFKLGIINKKAKRIKKPETKEEKKAYTILDKFVFKLKTLLGHRVANMATLLLLLTDEKPDDSFSLLTEIKEHPHV